MPLSRYFAMLDSKRAAGRLEAHLLPGQTRDKLV
jgi:hypothetical protein